MKDLHGKSLLAGRLGAPGGKTFRAINPASGIPLEPEFHEALASEVDAVLFAAEVAFKDYGSRPPEIRAGFLEAIAKEIEELGQDLLDRAHAETGLPLKRLEGERGRTCGQLRLFAQIVREGSWVDARIDPAQPARQPAPRSDLRRMLVPIGPVVVFGSSNFPLAFSAAGGDTASALAAGCTVVVKAHRAHPGTGELVAGAVTRAVAACGLPPAVYSLVHGGGASIGIAMVRHPATAAVGFTGSHAAGRALFDAAASRPRPIPVFAEMSSVNPVFILPGASRERGAAIARRLLDSFTLGVGQFCTKPGLVFVARDAGADAFLEALSSAVRAAPCGTMLTPGIRTAFLENQAKVTGLPGVTMLASSGSAAASERTEAVPGVAVTTADHFLAEPALATEAFGPFTLVIVADSAGQFAACAESLEGQLTAALHGTPGDLAEAGPLAALLQRKAGRLIVNGFPTGVEVSPAMNHGGPYPATTDVRYTSVGTAALLRFARPVCYQDFPESLLPPALRDSNPLHLLRLIDGVATREGSPKA